MWLKESPDLDPIEFDTTADQMWVWNQTRRLRLGQGRDIETPEDMDAGSPVPAGDHYVHKTVIRCSQIAKSRMGGTAGLSEVRFFYVPVRPMDHPCLGGTGVALDAVLNWRPGREAVKHEVY